MHDLVYSKQTMKTKMRHQMINYQSIRVYSFLLPTHAYLLSWQQQVSTDLRSTLSRWRQNRLVVISECPHPADPAFFLQRWSLVHANRCLGCRTATSQDRKCKSNRISIRDLAISPVQIARSLDQFSVNSQTRCGYIDLNSLRLAYARPDTTPASASARVETIP